MKDRAVVGAPVHEIHEIASREGGIPAIETDAHLTLAGLQGDQGSAAQTGHAGCATAEVPASGIGGTGPEGKGEKQ